MLGSEDEEKVDRRCSDALAANTSPVCKAGYAFFSTGASTLADSTANKASEERQQQPLKKKFMSYQQQLCGMASGGGPFGDTTYTKVFVGGLAWETQKDAMRRYFEQFGEILEAVVITDKNTGRSKGYGFVTFRDPEAARRACADPSPVIDGRQANCNLASFGARVPRPPFFPGARYRPMRPTASPPHPGTGTYPVAPTFPQFAPYYQQGYHYPQYGYPSYVPDYAYQQSLYNPFAGPQQQYSTVYSVPGTPPAVYSYGGYGPPMPGSPGYPPPQGFGSAQGPQQFMQYGGAAAAAAAAAAAVPLQSPATALSPAHSAGSSPSPMQQQQQQQYSVPPQPQPQPQYSQPGGAATGTARRAERTSSSSST